MAFKKRLNLDVDKAIQLGGKDDSGKAHPTSVEGYYLGYREIDGDYGKAKLHVFQTEDGNMGVWGKSRLDTQLGSDLVGTMVRVTFTGMIPSRKKGRKPAYGYEVEFDDENTVDVSGLSAAISESTSDAEDDHTDGEGPSEVGDAAYDDAEESDPGEEETQPDAAPAARARPPRQPAQAASATQQAKVKALLAGGKRQAS